MDVIQYVLRPVQSDVLEGCLVHYTVRDPEWDGMGMGASNREKKASLYRITRSRMNDPTTYDSFASPFVPLLSCDCQRADRETVGRGGLKASHLCMPSFDFHSLRTLWGGTSWNRRGDNDQLRSVIRSVERER